MTWKIHIRREDGFGDLDMGMGGEFLLSELGRRQKKKDEIIKKN